jgi:hypothetical protein
MGKRKIIYVFPIISYQASVLLVECCSRIGAYFRWNHTTIGHFVRIRKDDGSANGRGQFMTT